MLQVYPHEQQETSQNFMSALEPMNKKTAVELRI
jgi:hypothetical protein